MWSRKSDCCVRCGTNELPHGGHGLCMKCYEKDWAKKNASRIKAYQSWWYQESKKRINYQKVGREYMNGPVDEVLAKFGNKCAECGSTEHLHIHHIDHKGSNVPRDQRNNNLENLQVLCRKCHGRLHGRVEGWSRKHERCLRCGSTENKHHAHGYCVRCFWRVEADLRKEGIVRAMRKRMG